MVVQRAFLFTGQGGYAPGLLSVLAREFGAGDLLGSLADVSGAEGVGGLDALISGVGPSLERLLLDDPGLLQAAIYASSVALAQALRERGMVAGVHLGLSLGEIAALAAAGVVSPQDGMRIVTRRSHVLATIAAPVGYMAAIPRPPTVVAGLVELLDRPDLAVAGQSGPELTVISGGEASMDLALRVASSAGLDPVRLASPYPFHSPVLEPLRQRFEDALAGIEWRPAEVEVRSAISGRAYRTDEDMARSLGGHLVAAFNWPAAVRALRASGTEEFVECGAGTILTGLTRLSLSPADRGRVVIPADPTESDSALQRQTW
jgi:acyl transferase domain-containing protein